MGFFNWLMLVPNMMLIFWPVTLGIGLIGAFFGWRAHKLVAPESQKRTIKSVGALLVFVLFGSGLVMSAAFAADEVARPFVFGGIAASIAGALLGFLTMLSFSSFRQKRILK